MLYSLFFLSAMATPEIYTLSLHDALPIFPDDRLGRVLGVIGLTHRGAHATALVFIAPLFIVAAAPRVFADRKSTRLNSSHRCISYAVFCLKKKKECLLSVAYSNW